MNKPSETAALIASLKSNNLWHMDGLTRSVNELVTHLHDGVVKPVMAWDERDTAVHNMRFPDYSELAEWVTFSDMLTRGTAQAVYITRMLNKYSDIKSWMGKEFNVDDTVTVDDMFEQFMVADTDYVFTAWVADYAKYAKANICISERVTDFLTRTAATTVLRRSTFTSLLLELGTLQCRLYHAKQIPQRMMAFNF